MMRLTYVMLILFVISSIPYISVAHAESFTIPNWIDELIGYWQDGSITHDQFIRAVQYLVDSGYIYMVSDDGNMMDTTVTSDLIQDLKSLVNDEINDMKDTMDDEMYECRGIVECFSGTVGGYPEADIIRIGNELVITSIATTFKSYESGSDEAKEYMNSLCPIGSKAFVDVDEAKIGTVSGYVLGLVYCNGYNLNDELAKSEHGFILEAYCHSEFSQDEWAIRNGCPVN